MPGISRRTRVYLEITLRPPGYFVDFLNFASDFAPDQLSDSGKLASFQNGAPNTLCFPWKFPETQSAGDPLFSFLFAGKAYAGQGAHRDTEGGWAGFTHTTGSQGFPSRIGQSCTRRHGGRRGPPTGCALLVLLLLTRDSDRFAARWTPYSTGDLSRLATFLRLLTSSLSLPRAH